MPGKITFQEIMNFVAFVLVLTLPKVVYSYKIVIFVPTLSNSQLVFNYRLGDLLAEAGHDVTMYRPQYNPDALKGSSNLTREIRFTAWKDAQRYRKLQGNMGPNVFGSSNLQLSVLREYLQIITKACENQVADEELMQQLRKKKFDIALAHMYDFCPHGIIHALKIPTYIWVSSGPLYDYMGLTVGAPTPLSYVPNALSGMSDRMNFFERIKNIFGMGALLAYMEFWNVRPQTAVFRKHFGDDFPRLDTIAGNSPLVFVNSVEFVDFPRPILHKIIYIGGIGMKTAKPLSEDWKGILDASQEGTVLISMGSVVNSSLMSTEQKMAFLNSFRNFPTFTFIWKYENADFPEAEGVKNVYHASWVPQKDLFGHPKLKGFITHGGYNSFLEAAFAGVPTISIPLFSDQYGTSRRAERHGIGVPLDKFSLTEESITAALKKILRDPKYLTNAKRISGMLKKRPTRSEDLVRKWVEFLAEYKELPNLVPIGKDLNLFYYFCVDVLMGFFIIFFVFFGFFYFSCKLCRNYVHIHCWKVKNE